MKGGRRNASGRSPAKSARAAKGRPAPSPAAPVPAPDHTFRVAKLRAGTVVDHLVAGTALRCLAILGIPADAVTTVGLNLPSRRMKRKDILKLENRVLTASELARIALLGPRATVVVIEDYRVVKKIPLELPTVIDGVVQCPNPSCITHHNPVTPRVRVESSEPLRLRCHYCERRIRPDEVEFVPSTGVPSAK